MNPNKTGFGVTFAAILHPLKWLDHIRGVQREIFGEDGKKKVETGRWTDILMKQGGKWLCIGDNGGETPKKQDD